MPAPTTLPLEPPDTARPRARRASAGQRSKDRVTSLKLKPRDELVLDALRAEFGVEFSGEAIRRAMYEAAAARGIDVDHLGQEHATAA